MLLYEKALFSMINYASPFWYIIYMANYSIPTNNPIKNKNEHSHICHTRKEAEGISAKLESCPKHDRIL